MALWALLGFALAFVRSRGRKERLLFLRHAAAIFDDWEKAPPPIRDTAQHRDRAAAAVWFRAHIAELLAGGDN